MKLKDEIIREMQNLWQSMGSDILSSCGEKYITGEELQDIIPGVWIYATGENAETFMELSKNGKWKSILEEAFPSHNLYG